MKYNVDLLTIEKVEDSVELFKLLNGTDKQGFQFLIDILVRLIFPFSILLENSYVDKVYRDSYYHYYSNKHFNVSRECKRLTLFTGIIEESDFNNIEGHKKLQNQVVGFIVIRPISPGSIGRTLLNPYKLNGFSGYVRTTNFSFEILGAELIVNAFPFSSQDQETMTCAETTVYNIIEYYGNRYPEYKTTSPSEISNTYSDNSSERVLPSRGLPNYQISRLFKQFGFSPRTYLINEYGEESLKKIFHYYVESGIPIGVSIKANSNGIDVYHSIVCIGHSKNVNNIAVINNINNISFINSADFFDEYILMDDNLYPYIVKKYNEFTCYDKPKVFGLVVPLYKRIFLEATDAYSIAISIITDDKLKIDINSINFANHIYSEDKNPIILRLFLTTSRHYKKFKSINSPNQFMGNVYTRLPMPKFIWVAELSLKSLYEESKVFGEIIIDATASRSSCLNSLVLLHYPKRLGYRNPDEPLTNIFNMLSLDNDNADCTYQLYINNLRGE